MPIIDRDLGKYRRPQIFGPISDEEAREWEKIKKRCERIEKLKKLASK